MSKISNECKNFLCSDEFHGVLFSLFSKIFFEFVNSS